MPDPTSAPLPSADGLIAMVENRIKQVEAQRDLAIAAGLGIKAQLRKYEAENATLEQQLAEAQDPNYLGSTTWKGWKVDLYQGEETEDD